MTARAEVLVALAVPALAIAPTAPPLSPRTARSAATARTTSGGLGSASRSLGWRRGITRPGLTCERGVEARCQGRSTILPSHGRGVLVLPTDKREN